MSLGQRFERRLEGLVGGAFARVFKGQVEPVEIGTALQREAADKRNVMGNGQVLSPNRYRVTLSPSDHERLIPWENQLTTSLAELVQEYLDENSWQSIGDVEVYLARDDELHTGVFGVASRMEPGAPPRRRPHDSMSMPIIPGGVPGEYPEPPAGGYGVPAPDLVPGVSAGNGYGDNNGYGDQGYGQQPQAQPEYANRSYGEQNHGQPPAYVPPAAPVPPAGPGYGAAAYGAAGAASAFGAGGYGGGNGGGGQFDQGGHAPPPPRRQAAMLIVDQSNRRFDLRSGSNVIGRGTDADLQLLDQGISRRHVDIQFDGNFATAYDLGSTNGTTVNGHEISSQMLRHGDVVRVGHTRIVFHQERS